MSATQTPDPDWQALATNALTTDQPSDPGGDLITSGTTTATKLGAVLAPGVAAVGAWLVSFLNNFKEQPLLGIAAAVIFAAGLLALAWILCCDFRSRTRVTEARLGMLGLLAKEQQAESAAAASASDRTAVPPNVIPVSGFDVRAGDRRYNLLAVGWSRGVDASAASATLMYLVGAEGPGALAWKTQDEIDLVIRAGAG
jgi:hypothetical protein